MNARIGLCSIGFLAAAALASCCGGSSKPLTIEDFCSQKAAKECQVTTKCVTKPDDCTTQRKQACMDWTATAMTDVRKFVPGNVGACVDKTNSVYSKSTITPADMADLDDTCNYVFQGSVAKTMPCTVKYDCKDKVLCDKGLCADKLDKGMDALCADPGAVCNSSQYCAMAMTVLKCTNKAGSGETCNDTTPCQDALRCLNGKCADRVGLGEACTSNDDCKPAAPFCDPYAGHKCDPGLSFAAGSNSCNDFGGMNAGAAGSTGSAGSGGAGSGGSDAAAGTAGGDAASAE